MTVLDAFNNNRKMGQAQIKLRPSGHRLPGVDEVYEKPAATPSDMAAISYQNASYQSDRFERAFKWAPALFAGMKTQPAS
ncbi:hypothetical protein [Rhodoferax fermentans]|uniref:hypothetical protein n=1 Tax=Rhodoferax fermentans TaxID=28066 RepID=UPI00117A837A|nr:hypothetical protein [Rhodoferax fermentans]